MFTKTVKNSWGSDTYTMDVEPKKSIRLYGTYYNMQPPCAYDITFKIGDKAEWGSYNLTYTGTIVSIGEKTVTIQHKVFTERTRLDFAEFAWRNFNFNAEKISRENAKEMVCL